MRQFVKIIVSFCILLILIPFTLIFCTIRGAVPSLLGPKNQYDSVWMSTDKTIEIVIRSESETFNNANNSNFEDYHDGTVRITRNNGIIEEYAFIVGDDYYDMYSCIEGDPRPSSVNDQVFATHENVLVWKANTYFSNKRFSAIIEQSELEEFSVGEEIKFERVKKGCVDNNYKQSAIITGTVVAVSASVCLACVVIIIMSFVTIIRHTIKERRNHRTHTTMQ